MKETMLLWIRLLQLTKRQKIKRSFLNAIIQILNTAEYLSGQVTDIVCFRSEKHGRNIACNDPEFMKVGFKNAADLILFNSWAAVLEILIPMEIIGHILHFNRSLRNK